MTFEEWEKYNTKEKIQLVKSWLQELIEINKKLGKEPKELYNLLKRKKFLKNNVKDISAYERADWNYNKEKKYDKVRTNFRGNW